MNSRFLYILPQSSAQALALKHCAITHSIDLPNGNVLMSAEFNFEDQKDAFESYGVECIAHDGELITESQAAQLAHLGIQVGHTAKQARALAKKIHPLL